MVGLARSPPARQGRGEQRLRYEANPPLLTKFHTLPMCPIRMSSHLCNLLADSNKKFPSQGLTLRSESRDNLFSLPSRKEEDQRSRGFRGWVTHYSLCSKHKELNLPSIALRLSLGLNRLRLSIVYIGISSAFGLHDFPLFHRAVKLSRGE